LLKNLEVIIATQLLPNDSFDSVSKMITEWIQKVSDMATEQRKQKGEQSFGMCHANTKGTVESWQTSREDIGFISAVLQETVANMNKQY